MVRRVKGQTTIAERAGGVYDGIHRSHEPSLTSSLFELDWEDHVPVELVPGVHLATATVEDTLEFTRAHYASIFGMVGSDQRFFSEAPTPAKERFLSMSDRFAFREGSRVIGLLVGHPVDWSTYYWRSVCFLPEHQGRGLLAAALERTDPVMRRAGIVRVEGEAAPTNYRQVRLLHRLGYCVTGTVNSERWGNVLRLTKYLQPEAAACFATQFCQGPTAPSAGSSKVDYNPEGGSHEEVRCS